MQRYFKLVCLHDEDPQFILRNFQEGRARIGWSPPNTDLRKIKNKKWDTLLEQERITWRYTQFLIERILPSHRIVIQRDQPIKDILIGEVIAPGYDFAPGDLDDFNHLLHVNPLTPEPISVNLKEVSLALKHDLSKRGHYYEIYSKESISELDLLVKKSIDKTLDLHSIRTDEVTQDQVSQLVKNRIIEIVSRNWPAKSFETFCGMLCKSISYIEVSEIKDSHKGWDLLIRILNPLTGKILLDNIPVQCKNYIGKVNIFDAIDDLERCIKNSRGDLAFLFILGDLTPEFQKHLQERQEQLSQELNRQVTLEVIDQVRIAELYARHMDETGQESAGEH